MHFALAHGRLHLRDGEVAIADYVFDPTEPQLESPRPYATLRTRSGREDTAYRPDDHVWHKGLSLALPVVGAHNFWGGPTYVHGEGYVQKSNNGAQVHRAFRPGETPIADAVAGVARIEESLDWVAEGGGVVLVEERTLTARAVDDDTWALTWRSVLRNVSRDVLGFGSPTSKGRDDAGYAGIFWRGPESFTGGAVAGPEGELGDAARGVPGPWLSFTAPDRSVGVLVLDASEGALADPPWFARSEEYAGLNPAPFFFEETPLAPGATLVLGAVVVVGTADVGRFAASIGADLVAEVRRTPSPTTTEPETEATE